MLHSSFHSDEIVPITFLPDISLPYALKILNGQRFVHNRGWNIVINLALEYDFATIYSPAFGPISMRISAERMISSSCSTTTTVLPMSLSLFITEISLSVSLGCSPMLGSSNIYIDPTRELPKAVTRFILWLSPPERVLLVLSRERYDKPTSCMYLRRDVYFFDGFGYDTMFIFSQLEIIEEIQQLIHIHCQKFMNILSSDLHIQCIFAKPAAFAYVASSPPGESAKHIFILDLVPVGFDPFEKFIQSYNAIFFCISLSTFPKNMFYFL
jgi:hypothetical protein